MSAPHTVFEVEPPEPAKVRDALRTHHQAFEAWIKSTPGDRAQQWRAVELAWRLCKQLGADAEAARQSAVLMRAEGKLRSIT